MATDKSLPRLVPASSGFSPTSQGPRGCGKLLCQFSQGAQGGAGAERLGFLLSCLTLFLLSWMLLVPQGAEDLSLVGQHSVPGTGGEGFLLLGYASSGSKVVLFPGFQGRAKRSHHALASVVGELRTAQTPPLSGKVCWLSPAF